VDGVGRRALTRRASFLLRNLKGGPPEKRRLTETTETQSLNMGSSSSGPDSYPVLTVVRDCGASRVDLSSEMSVERRFRQSSAVVWTNADDKSPGRPGILARETAPFHGAIKRQRMGRRCRYPGDGKRGIGARYLRHRKSSANRRSAIRVAQVSKRPLRVRKIPLARLWQSGVPGHRPAPTARATGVEGRDAAPCVSFSLPRRPPSVVTMKKRERHPQVSYLVVDGITRLRQTALVFAVRPAAFCSLARPPRLQIQPLRQNSFNSPV
jgi:hypothetical protein